MYNSGFVDDIMFSHNGANGAESNSTLFFVDFIRCRHRGRSLMSTFSNTLAVSIIGVAGKSSMILGSQTTDKVFVRNRIVVYYALLRIKYLMIFATSLTAKCKRVLEAAAES